jgi:hypothetical protein
MNFLRNMVAANRFRTKVLLCSDLQKPCLNAGVIDNQLITGL